MRNMEIMERSSENGRVMTFAVGHSAGRHETGVCHRRPEPALTIGSEGLAQPGGLRRF